MAGHVLSVDDLCQAVEATLKAGLPTLVEALGLDDEHYATEIQEWQQLPDSSAISSATLPVVAISSPGIIGRPTIDGRGETRATWRIETGFFDRGKDHAQTQARVRNWVAFARAVLLTSKTLGGVAEGLVWVSEGYRLVPQRSSARTFAGGVLAVDVTATNVVDLGLDVTRLVQSTHPVLTVRPPA